MISTLHFCMLILIFIGAVGMAVGSKRQPRQVQKQRWIKFTAYLLIITLVLESILYDFFWYIAPVITLFTVAEFLKVCRKIPTPDIIVTGFTTFIIVIVFFLLFALNIPSYLQLTAYIGVINFDGFCQVCGQLFGKTKLLSSISPAKTLEGMFGGILFCLLASAGMAMLMQKSLLWGVSTGIIIATAAFSGDILASYFKRKAGIKDYSNWLPGQGGFLDRFDSFFFTGFVFYILYKWFHYH